MAYRPAFDISTLHYANKAIAWLAGDHEQIPVRRMLREVTQIAIWNQENEGRTYLHLNRIIARASGATEEPTGTFHASEQPSGPNDFTEEIVQLIFALLCLASVVEAIILGEEVFYIPGTSSYGFPLNKLAPYLDAVDREHGPVWKQVSPERHQIYEKWVDDGPLSERLVTEAARAVEWLATESIAVPFIDLGGHLYDTSAGLATPVAVDAYAPIHSPILLAQELEKLVPVTPLTWTQSILNRLGRTLGYLINGVCYQEISLLTNVDYVANPLRAPFLFGLHNGSGPTDKEAMRKALHAAVGYTPDEVSRSRWSESDLRREAIDYSYMLFALTVASSTVVDDLLPAAYHLREELKPLRVYIRDHGWDGRFDEGMRDLVLTLQQKKKFVAASETRWLISIPLPTQRLAWLYTPHYPGRPWLRSVRVVADQYRTIASLSERIEKLTERSLQPEALRKHWLTRPF